MAITHVDLQLDDTPRQSWFWALIHKIALRRAWKSARPHAFTRIKVNGGPSELLKIEPMEGHLDLWKVEGEKRAFTSDQILWIDDMFGHSGNVSSRSK